MNVVFLPEAQTELFQAIVYYDGQLVGLGDRFNSEFWHTINKIIENPHTWTLMGHGTRKCNLKDFPYGVIYREQSGSILIVAVMNLYRKPGYWKKRL